MQLDGTESKVRLNNTHFFNLCSVYLSLKLFYLARAGMFTMCKCLLQLVMYMPDKQATASFRNMRKKRLVLMHNFSKILPHELILRGRTFKCAKYDTCVE